MSFLNRLSQGLSKTRQQLSTGFAHLIFGQKKLDTALIEAIETTLLRADFGVTVTQQLIQDLTAQLDRGQLADSQAVWQQLRQSLIKLLTPCEVPLLIPQSSKPFVILVVGVNGVGKTTSIAKLSYYFQQQQSKVLLAAGDTFRAAATEQLRVWSERTKIPLIAQQQGADSASVLYDALQAAQARQFEVVIADTAGRLHTAAGLLQELQKITRVLKKLDHTAPQEIMLVIDATMGQNALKQAVQFQQAVPISSLMVTKLDGTAKGGILFALAQQLALPIRFIGMGEGIEDLQVFNAQQFVQAVLAEKHSD